MSDVVPVYLYCPAFIVSVNGAPFHADRPPSHSAYLALSAKLSGIYEQGLQAAHQHAAQHLLLSLTRQWLIAERHLTQY